MTLAKFTLAELSTFVTIDCRSIPTDRRRLPTFASQKLLEADSIAGLNYPAEISSPAVAQLQPRVGQW